MDRRGWIVLSIVFVLTWAAVLKICQSELQLKAFYFLAIWLLTWIPGCVGLIGARVEGFKIPIFGEPRRIHLFALLIAGCLGIYLNSRSVLRLEKGWLWDLVTYYPLTILFVGLPSAFGEMIFWWGYLYKKLEGLRSWAIMLLIGALWGIWHAPIILFTEYYYAGYRLEGVAMMSLFTAVLSPLMFYFRRRGQCIMTPAIFFATLSMSYSVCSAVFHSKRSQLIDGSMGIDGIKVLFCCSCFTLILLWRKEAMKKIYQFLEE